MSGGEQDMENCEPVAKFPTIEVETMEAAVLKEEEEQEQEYVHPIFVNDLVMKEILTCIGFKDLLTCSLVSRQWNFQAREVLRGSGNCYAAIKDIAGHDSDVIKLHSLVQKTFNSPFSGLSVYLNKRIYRGKGYCWPPWANAGGKKEEDEKNDFDSENEENEVFSDESDDDEYPPFFDGSSRSRYSMNNYCISEEEDESDFVEETEEDAIKALSSVLKALGPQIKHLKLTSGALLPGRLLFCSTQWLRPLRQNWNLAFHILKNLAPSLEGILIDVRYEYDFSEHSDIDIGTLRLPKLKTLEVLPNEIRLTSDHQSRSLIRNLVSAAPDLKQLLANITPCFLEDLLRLEERSHPVQIQQLDLYPRVDDLDTTLKFALQEPRLKKFKFTSRCENSSTIYPWLLENQQQKFRQSLTGLLHSSTDSLTTLSVEHLDLLLLVTQWGLPVLSQLKRLELIFSPAIDRHGYGTCTLAKIDFKRYFPQLKQVSITDGSNTRDDPLEFYMSDEFKEQKTTYSCSTVTSLRYKFGKKGSVPRKLNMCRGLFPNVNHLNLEFDDSIQANFPARLWTAWPDLLSLSFSSLKLNHHNYDDCLLGVSEKDGERIMSGELDDDFGSKELLQIVPVKPGIFNLKKLQRISFGLVHSPVCYPSGYPRRNSVYDPIFLSLPAVCLIRSRMPELCIELEREVCSNEEECYLSMKYLKPQIRSLTSVKIPDDCDVHRRPMLPNCKPGKRGK